MLLKNRKPTDLSNDDLTRLAAARVGNYRNIEEVPGSFIKDFDSLEVGSVVCKKQWTRVYVGVVQQVGELDGEPAAVVQIVTQKAIDNAVWVERCLNWAIGSWNSGSREPTGQDGAMLDLASEILTEKAYPDWSGYGTQDQSGVERLAAEASERAEAVRSLLFPRPGVNIAEVFESVLRSEQEARDAAGDVHYIVSTFAEARPGRMKLAPSVRSY